MSQTPPECGTRNQGLTSKPGVVPAWYTGYTVCCAWYTRYTRCMYQEWRFVRAAKHNDQQAGLRCPKMVLRCSRLIYCSADWPGPEHTLPPRPSRQSLTPLCKSLFLKCFLLPPTHFNWIAVEKRSDIARRWYIEYLRWCCQMSHKDCGLFSLFFPFLSPLLRSWDWTPSAFDKSCLLSTEKNANAPLEGSKTCPTSHQTKFTLKTIEIKWAYIGDQCPLEAINTLSCLKTWRQILTNEWGRSSSLKGGCDISCPHTKSKCYC